MRPHTIQARRYVRSPLSYTRNLMTKCFLVQIMRIQFVLYAALVGHAKPECELSTEMRY